MIAKKIPTAWRLSKLRKIFKLTTESVIQPEFFDQNIRQLASIWWKNGRKSWQSWFCTFLEIKFEVTCKYEILIWFSLIFTGFRPKLALICSRVTDGLMSFSFSESDFSLLDFSEASDWSLLRRPESEADPTPESHSLKMRIKMKTRVWKSRKVKMI